MGSEISPGELRLLVALMLWPLWVVPIAFLILVRLLGGRRKK
jgi:hypothetical protein